MTGPSLRRIDKSSRKPRIGALLCSPGETELLLPVIYTSENRGPDMIAIRAKLPNATVAARSDALTAEIDEVRRARPAATRQLRSDWSAVEHVLEALC